MWTVMVYLAGDNNLEGFGHNDLAELKAVGSTDRVAAVAQFDRMSDQVTRRYYLTAGQDLDADCVSVLPETNSGDPGALLDFVAWACQTYPAERYALVLWNHGGGWKDIDIYDVAREKGVAQQITRGQVRGLASGKASRSFFRSTLEKLVVEAAETERAILYDDSSADFLDNQELRSVLRQATRRLGGPVDLLGFDACLMNMLEVHYQVRDLCRVAVGSQENEPGSGWPYDRVLARLVEDPEMSPEALGDIIVNAYVDFYRTHHPHLAVTQSAVHMAGIETVAEAVDALGTALEGALDRRETLGLLFGALRSAQAFTDRDYVDLLHFCSLLADDDPGGSIGLAARQVVDLLDGEASPLVAAQQHGPGVANARGLSIYLPARVLSPLYAELEFAKNHRWDDFLNAFVRPD
jgi:hypothetical protein